MSETLRSKLAAILADENIYKVEINVKCKTRDGMIYTLLSSEHSRAEGAGETSLPYAEAVHTCTVSNLLHITETIEKGDGYFFSVEELVAVKHTEIVRIWAELGDLYYDKMPEHG